MKLPWRLLENNKLHLVSAKPLERKHNAKTIFQMGGNCRAGRRTKFDAKRAAAPICSRTQNNCNNNTTFCLARLNRHFTPSQLVSAKKE